MYERIDCIALRLVKHSDRSSILSAYTRQRGRMSFLVPAGNGKEAARRRAVLMPGSRFSCVANIREGNQIPNMRDVMPRGEVNVFPDPVKSATTLFIADFMNTLLREQLPDELMFEYCDSMLAFHDSSTKGIANFHLLFMIRMMHFAGIEPDVSTYSPGYLFDMVDGVFRDSAPLHGKYLERHEAQAVANLLRMNHRNMSRWKLSASQRNQILDRLIEYYSLHFSSLRSMKSLDVLRSLF